MLQNVFNQAVALHQSGKLTQAEPLYLQVLAALPLNFQAHYMFAVLRCQQQRHTEALNAVDTALRLKPDAADALMLRGALLLGAGQREAALTNFSTLVAHHPAHAEGWYNRGVTLADLQRHDEAVAAFDRALALAPSAVAWNGRGASLRTLERHEESLRSFDQALVLQPGFLLAQYNRGVVLMALKRDTEAIAVFEAVLARKPDWAEAWNNHGVALQKLNRLAEALTSYNRVLELQPQDARAWSNRAAVLQNMNRYAEAVASYDRALAVSPNNAKCWRGRGAALSGVNRLDEAIDSFDRAIALVPEDVEAWTKRANVLMIMQRFDAAAQALDRARAIDPEYLPALSIRAALLCETGDIAGGIALYQQHARATHGASFTSAPEDPPHKQRHDAEQLAYFAAQGMANDGRYQITGGERLATAAVNPANAADIAVQWQNSRPQIVVIDNLLTEAALQGLRRFCWGSTIWRKSYKNGYLGAMPEHGFACPLLAQIAEELRDTFPTIFGTHGLRMLWGFKYDSTLGGIRIHADQAAVNVNFWITPDEANLNPDNGGLIIWDASAPLDWEITRYNGDDDAVRAFLASANSKPVTVPYRANRAVIFDSDLFHETDKIEFKEGYLNRRINITMLYGRRTFHGG